VTSGEALTRLTRLTAGPAAAVRPWAGGKAAGLAVLLGAGLPVPPTWVVPPGAPAGPGDLGPLAAAAPRWAVRSSATAEDGRGRSYAGMFSTELDVPAAGLPGAVRRVRASAGSGRAAAYRRQAAPGEPAVRMAVLLQPFQPPLRSGVWLGRGPGRGRLEWAAGGGDAIVSGTLTPHWEEWTAAGLAGHDGPGPLTDAGRPVGAACLDVQAALGELADLEFAILGSGLVWLQFRPVTAGLTGGPGHPAADQPADGAADPGAGLVRGTPAAAGRASGPARLLATADGAGGTGWEPGGVLLTEQTSPDWLPLMTEAAALVTAEGGMLCHAAIVARELGLPCVTGVGRAALRRLAAGPVVEVDGSAGTVTVRTAAPDGGR